jgi:hypothetical protein
MQSCLPKLPLDYCSRLLNCLAGATSAQSSMSHYEGPLRSSEELVQVLSGRPTTGLEVLSAASGLLSLSTEPVAPSDLDIDLSDLPRQVEELERTGRAAEAHLRVRDFFNRYTLYKEERCPFYGCRLTFNNKNNLFEHVQSRHCSYAPYNCATCRKQFSTKKKFDRHNREAHGKTNNLSVCG